jgi:hypothetical protein
MISAMYIVFALIAFVALYFVLFYVVGAWRKYRGKMVIIFPVTRKPVAVNVDVGHAAITNALSDPEIRLTSCTRWPERQDCEQECVQQIELAPEDCTIRTILAKWYRDKLCVFCGKPVQLLGRHLALLDPTSGETVECMAVAPEKLTGTLASHAPVCWNCHIVETFRRMKPELVVDRPWREDAPGPMNAIANAKRRPMDSTFR